MTSAKDLDASDPGLTDGVLHGVRVLEIGERVAIPSAGRLLAGFGASVVKVERPEGDPTRHWGPFPEGRDDRECSGTYLWLNTGKRSVVVDLTTDAGRRAVLRLARRSDLVLTSLSRAELSQFGLSFDAVSAENPAVGMVSVSNFGLTGPNADFEATALTSFATGGQMWMTGEPERPPVKNFGSQAEHQAGLHAFAAALTLLYQSLVRGIGDHVDISIQEAQASILEVNGPNAFNYGTESFRHGNVLRATWGLYPCQDGYVGIHVLDRNLPQFFHAMGRDDLWETYRDPMRRAQDNDLLEALIYSWCADHSERELFQAGVDAGAPIAYLPYVDELLTWPGLLEKEFWKVVDHPAAGPLPYPDSAIKVEGDPFVVTRAPLLGEHSTEVFQEFGFGETEIRELRQAEPDSP